MKRVDAAGRPLSLGAALLLLALGLPCGGAAAAHGLQEPAGAARRQQFAPAGEKFSVLLPAAPEVSAGSKLYAAGSDELVEADFKVYSLFSGGTLHTVQSYEVSQPREVLSDILRGRGKVLSFGAESKPGGVRARPFTAKYEGVSHREQYFLAGRHIYLVEAARRGPHHPDIDRFIDSFKVSDAAAPGPPAGAQATQAAAPDRVFTSEEVTAKAFILSRQYPSFTPGARRAARDLRISGKVRLRVTLLASGRVGEIEVLSGLPYGLTREAVESTRLMMFLPAEKDGAPVAPVVFVEHNFQIF